MITPRRMAVRIDDWMTGELFGDEGMAELGRNVFFSRHIDEVMGPKWKKVGRVWRRHPNRWRPTKSEIVRVSLMAFAALRDRLIANAAVSFVILDIPVKKTKLPVAAPVKLSVIAKRLDFQPPELFIYRESERAGVNRRLRERSVVIRAADDWADDSATLVATAEKPAARTARSATVTTDMLCLFQAVGKRRSRSTRR